ncbi:hypothetical protein INR49_016410 [Caranx melampygus]|nr:hypothetical protein INR49_016410 [Caranx melampygus]
MALWILGAALLARAAGFYLPGLAPVSFCEGGKDQVPDCKSAIELFVNRLDSVESVLPYEYTAENTERPSENLGQVLFGERIEPSPYKDLRHQQPNRQSKMDFLKKGMLLNYQHHWIVDNMPVTWCYDVEDGQKFCNPVSLLAVTSQKESNFNEKDAFTSLTTWTSPSTITLLSTNNSELDGCCQDRTQSYENPNDDSPDCSGGPKFLKNKHTGNFKIPYTYSVSFVHHELVVIVLFLSGMVAMIMLRTRTKTSPDTIKWTLLEDAQEEFGWKLVHGDVFDRPGRGCSCRFSLALELRSSS